MDCSYDYQKEDDEYDVHDDYNYMMKKSTEIIFYPKKSLYFLIILKTDKM